MKYPGFIGKSYLAGGDTQDETINLLLARGERGWIFKKVPGLLEKQAISNPEVLGPTRGMFWLNGVTYKVAGDTIYYKNDNTGASGTLGPISNDGNPVTFAASRTQLVIHSGKIPWLVTLPSTLAGAISWMAADVAAVAYCNTFFLFLADAGNGFFYSEPGDANTGSPVNFQSEETHASKFRMLHVLNNQPWLFGDLNIQPYYQTLDPAKPFLPNLSASIAIGSAAKFASIDIQGTACWLGQSKEGGLAAYITDGFSARQVSKPGVESSWHKSGAAESASTARSWSFFKKGHLLWGIWFPSRDESWAYDLTTDNWCRLANRGAGVYEAHPVCCSAYDAQSGVNLAGDRRDGRAYEMDFDYLDFDGDRIYWLRRGPELDAERQRQFYPQFELIVTAGVGTAVGNDVEVNPQIHMRYSEDGGKTWSPSLDQPMGGLGHYEARLIWAALGSGGRRTFEVSGEASVLTTIHEALITRPGA